MNIEVNEKYELFWAVMTLLITGVATSLALGDYTIAGSVGFIAASGCVYEQIKYGSFAQDNSL